MTIVKQNNRWVLTLFVSVIFHFGCSDKVKDENSKSTTNQASVQLTEKTKADENEIKMMLGCGYGGEVSVEFKEIKNLIADKNYEEVKNYLDSTGLKQLLSVVALDDLYERRLIKLSSNEKEIIARVKLSPKTYAACEGCSGYSIKGTISKIFANKPKGVDWSNILYEIKFRLGLVKPAGT